MNTTITTALPKVILATSFALPLAICVLQPGTLSAQSGGSSYYVSAQNGNDGWSGLLPSPNSSRTDGPFQTLARAQSSARGSSVKTITVRAGTYSIASGFVLNSSDSNEQWVGYAGETAVLDGGGSGGLNVNWPDSITIRSLSFSNCGQSCISGSHLTNSTIDSNRMNGQNSATNGAVNLWYGSSSNRIIHNLIENCQGNGIVLSTAEGDPPASNNIIDRNIIQNVATNTKDAGAVYMFDRSHTATGNQITNNVITGVGGTGYLFNWTKAFYLDDLMSDVLISGNICRSCGEYAWQIHAGDHITIVNNIFDLSSSGTLLGLYQTINSDYGLSEYGMNGNVFQRNIVYFSGSAPSSLYAVSTVSNDALPADSGNLYYSAAGANIPNGQTIVDSGPVHADPQLADPSSGNYSMPSSSPAFGSIGFQALPTDQGPGGQQIASGGGSGGGGTGGGPIANGTYTIKNNHSGFVLDDPAWASSGAQVIQFAINNPLSGNQRWVLTFDSNSQGYTIVNQGSSGFLTDKGGLLFENSQSGDATQIWTISSGSGAYVIKNAGTGRVIDDPGSSLVQIGIITWPANGGTNQGWIFQ
jgi:hypothetical protein